MNPYAPSWSAPQGDTRSTNCRWPAPADSVDLDPYTNRYAGNSFSRSTSSNSSWRDSANSFRTTKSWEGQTETDKPSSPRGGAQFQIMRRPVEEKHEPPKKPRIKDEMMVEPPKVYPQVSPLVVPQQKPAGEKILHLSHSNGPPPVMTPSTSNARFANDLDERERKERTRDWHNMHLKYPRPFSNLPRLEQALGYEFRNRELLFEALTHRSALEWTKGSSYSADNEWVTRLPWNERLEFLGDSVVELVVTSMLMEKRGTFTEGELSCMRSSLVTETTMATKIAPMLFITECLTVSESERRIGNHLRESVVADALEALFGAIFWDSNFDTVSSVIKRLWQPLIDNAMVSETRTFKQMFQEWMQQNFDGKVPTYEIVAEEGPPHRKVFRVACILPGPTPFDKGRALTEGVGATKKKAENIAAELAYNEFALGLGKQSATPTATATESAEGSTMEEEGEVIDSW